MMSLGINQAIQQLPAKATDYCNVVFLKGPSKGIPHVKALGTLLVIRSDVLFLFVQGPFKGNSLFEMTSPPGKEVKKVG